MIHVGEVWETANFGKMQVLQYIDHTKIKVKFLETGYETFTKGSQIYAGSVRDKLLPTVYGVGVTGDALTKVDGKHTKEYTVWREMLKRAYCPLYQTKFPTYIGCKVEEFFKYLPDFKLWAEDQVGFDQHGWDFDKDILGSRDSKEYSRANCVFVPKEINYAFLKWEAGKQKDLPTGVHEKKGEGFSAKSRDGNGQQSSKFSTSPYIVFRWYKENKEAYLKFLANKWEGLVDDRVIDKLKTYEVV